MYFLDFRYPTANTGGSVVPGQLIVPEDVGDASCTLDRLRTEPRIVFVTHGFNVNRKSGREQLKAFGDAVAAQLAFDAAIVAVTWPGDSWAGPVGYPLEGNDADDTAAEFAKFIVTWLPGGTEFSFVSHSLGARVVFETIKRLPKDAYPVRQVCVMAAAVDDFSVAEPPAYLGVVNAADRVAVLASKRDQVLRWTYPLGDWVQSILFFWRDVSGLALGYHGPRKGRFNPVPANVVHEQIANSADVGHGDYLFSGDPSEKERRAAAYAAGILNGEAVRY